jgi:hypothetical protein
MRRLLFFGALCGSVLAAGAFGPSHVRADGDGHQGEDREVIYDSTVQPLPGNLNSVGAEAYSFTELGDEVTFAKMSRVLDKVTVTMSSWGCQQGHWYSNNCVTEPGATFSVPITFTFYHAPTGSGYTAGTQIASKTQTFDIPYRPSTSAHCSGGRWWNGTTCFNGLAVNITFDFTPLHPVLPNTVVFGIAYNTSHYGPHPMGESLPCYTSSGGCPYDSLNIALAPTVTVGSKPHPNTLYQNAVYPGDYCDNGAHGVGTLRLDSPGNACWAGYIPAVRIVATTPENDNVVQVTSRRD